VKVVLTASAEQERTLPVGAGVPVYADQPSGLVMGRLDLFLRYGQGICLSAEDREKRAERAVDAWLLIHQV
ncbi:MAG: hypothetical protein AAF067_10155, partial [Pseudomonadota bacterium]